jgi:hypothetical protein
MEYLSFQPPALSGLRVFGGDVGLARAGQIEACVGQGVDHTGAVGNQAHADLIEDPRMQLVAPLRAGWGLSGVAHLLQALGVQRVGPAVALVH